MSLEGRTAEEIQALAELAESLGNNPKTRAGFLRGVKALNPDANIPEIDIPASLGHVVKEAFGRIEATEKKQAEIDARERIREQRKKALDKGVSAEDMPEIEKLMVEKQIPDHGTAAEFFKMSQRSAEPTPSSLQTRSFAPVLPDLKAFGGSLKEYGRVQARAVVDEFRGRRST
jgi:hypothetical protein